MPKHFHTVQVQYDPITEYWWVHYLDVMGDAELSPRAFKLEQEAVEHAEGIFDRGNADVYDKWDANEEWEGSRFRVHMNASA